MSRVDEHSSEWVEVQEDELMRRLRNLEWPKARPELRERCWREISRRLAEQQAQQEGSGRFTRESELDLNRSYEFSRRRAPRSRVGLPERWARPYEARAAVAVL